MKRRGLMDVLNLRTTASQKTAAVPEREREREREREGAYVCERDRYRKEEEGGDADH